MSITIFKRNILFAAFALLTGCSGAQPVPYTSLASSPYLKPNPQDDSGHVPLIYKSQADWTKYSKVMIEPVELYPGADNQFGGISENDRRSLAAYTQTQFATALGKRFAITATPGPGTLRVRLTLTGAASTTPVLSTLTRADIAGGLYNGVQAVRGKEGLMTGWVMYAVEIEDASSHRLLQAFEAKQYPNAYNIGATFGSLGAAKTGIDKGANMLVAQLQ